MTRIGVRGGAPSSVKTGSKEVDDVVDEAFDGPEQPDERPALWDLYDEALSKGYTYAFGRAVGLAARGKRLTGFEAEVDAEMTRNKGRRAQGFFVPWSVPIAARGERRSLSIGGSPGAKTAQIPYMLLIDVLRPKIAIARLGGRILDLIGSGPRGDVQLSTKRVASSVSWVGEGAAAASQSNMQVQSFNMQPYTCTAFTDVTRRMIKLGAPGFDTHVIDDLTTGIAVGVDSTAFNGNSPFQPLGLFQIPGVPSIGAHGDSGNGGTFTYSNLVGMNQTVLLYNGDSPSTARMGWVTSPQGKATLALTDKSATASTGRYCWESRTQWVDGNEVTLEHMMGYPAVATTLAPSASTEGSASNITAVGHGNFDDCWVNLFSGFDVVVNPFLQTSTGVVRVSAFQDVDVRFVRPSSFCVCTNIAAISPQTS